MARFVVDLGNVKLTDEEQSGIASAVHTAVIGHLATLANPGVHAATKTLNHAGMIFAAADPTAKVTRSVGKVAAAKIAKPAATTRSARKSG